MKIIKPSAEIMEHNVTPYEFIEKVGRTCYKSENHITEDSAEKFVGSLVKSQHMAMLEHETIYLVGSYSFVRNFIDDASQYYFEQPLKFFNITHNRIETSIISGSFRSFYELFTIASSYGNNTAYAIDFAKSLLAKKYPLVFEKFKPKNKLYYHNGLVKVCTRRNIIDTLIHEPKILSKHLNHTVKFVCDRGVSHEFVRHRVASFAQESTRYCNYSKDKFGNEITVIKPCFFEEGSPRYNYWERSCLESGANYFSLLEDGATPQEARSVLPNSLKTELIVTATEEEWQHIVNLRYIGTTGSPHPQIKEVMGLIINDLIKESNQRIKGDK